MKTRALVLAVALAAAAASPEAAAQSDCAELTAAPRAPLDEAMPISPGEGFIWIPGHWECQADEYQWVGGDWIRELPGYTWQPHSWQRDDQGRWHLRPGRWLADAGGDARR